MSIHKDNNSVSSYNICDIFSESKLLDTSFTFDNIKQTLHKFDTNSFVDEFDVWAFNRKLNDEHVNNLFKVLCEQTNPHFMGTIKVVKDTKNVCQIIDGQHRLEAIKMLKKEYPKKNMTIYVEVYHVDRIDNNIVHELFKMANSNLNISIQDDLNIFVIELVNKLAENPNLKNGIVDKNDGRINRPRISKKTLYEALKDNLKANHTQLSISTLVDIIEKINIQISQMSNLELFGRNNICDTNKNMKRNAMKYNFYLNLPGRYPPEKWIEMISSNK
jgi:hypothetical protein